jgi:uncharacterized repeat protein (TIGR01451 family)
MGGILSGISGYFSRHLILGTFLPVVIFVILTWLLVIPSLPTNWPILQPIQTFGAEWQILSFSFATIVLTGLLYNINIPLISLYEGYPWKELWIGQARTKKYQRLFAIAKARWNGAPHIEFELRDDNDGRSAAIEKMKALAGSTLFADFPAREDLVLPTRLGNVIRSFESYSLRQYGMDAVTFWPRLVSTIPKEYASAIDEAKTSFDFMLNCSALSSVLALIVFLTGSVYPSHFNAPGGWVFWVSELVLLCLAAHFSYRLSIGRARSWGNTVRTSFDLYRRDLLKQLGYTRVPETLEEEQRLWSNIGERIVYGDHYRLPQIAFVSRKTFVECEPNIATFAILRSVTAPEDAVPSASSDDYVTTITIRNTGNYNALKLSVTDTLPDDFVYRHESAQLSNPDDPVHVTQVSGTNPYTFSLGRLNYDRELVLKYRSVRLGQPAPSTKQDDERKSSLTFFNGEMLAYEATTDNPGQRKNETLANDGPGRT